MSDDGEMVPPEVKQARSLQESVVGKITEDTAQDSLSQAEGVIEYAVDIVLSQDTQQRFPTKEEVIRDLDSKFEDKKETRQFSCEKCDRYWWRSVPSRKQVSKCNRCKTKYEPIPRHQEWGWCKFKCEQCGHEFHGFGSLGNPAASPCYQCDDQCLPVEVYPRKRSKRDSKTRNTHSCNAKNCFHQVGRHSRHGPSSSNIQNSVDQASGPIGNSFNTSNAYYSVYQASENSSNRERQAGGHSGHNEGECPHPKSRRKKVLVYSEQHVSTGSTVATFLSQGSLYDPFGSDLSDIGEED